MFFKDLINNVVGNKSIVNVTALNGDINLHITTKTLAVTAVTNVVLLVLLLMIFSLLRNRFPRVYTPRLLLRESDFPISKLPSTLIGWLLPALKIKDDEILQCLGLDALMFLRYLRLCLKFCIIILPYGLVVALPTNYYGGVSDTDPTMSGLDRLTMGNVTPLSKTLWVHFIGVWVYTLVILYLMYREYVAYQAFRQKSLSNGDKYPHRYLVMVCNIPSNLRDQTKMKEYVEELFPDETLDVYVLEENNQWEKLNVKYEKGQRKLAASKVDLRKNGKRPQHHSELLGFSGPKVDSISFYEQEIKDLTAQIKEERTKPHKALGHAFVAYRSLKEAAIAGNGLAWDCYSDQLKARICPEKDDIVWENLKKDTRLRYIVSLVVNTAVQFFLIFFWSIPVGIASTMVSFQQLEREVPFFKNLEKLGPIMTGFISGFLSTVVIVLFFALLPYILAFLAYIKGIETNTEIHNDILEKLFVFKVLNQFVLYILGNTMLRKLSDILDHPSEIPSTMAKEMPTASNFFINFIMLRATTVFGFELLRIAPLLIINIRRKYLVKTSWDDKEAWEPPEMWFSQQYAEILLVFLMSISYSVLAPLVVPFAVLYFAFGYVTWMNQLLFVYVPKWEGDGQMWPIIFHRMMVTIIVFLLFMIGLFGLKQYAIIATLILPLLVICIIFWHNVNQTFSKQSANLTFTTCAKIRDLSPDIIEKKFLEYRQNEIIVKLDDKKLSVDETFNADDDFLSSDKM